MLVRQLGEKHNIGTAPNYSNAFKVFKNQSTVQLTKDFTRLIRKFIKNNEYVIIEGALNSVPIIKKIFKNYSYTFIYLYPWFVKNYYRRIMKRLQNDLDSNIQTVSFWNTIPEDILNKIYENGLEDSDVKKYILNMTKIMKKSSNKRYKHFKTNNLNMYTVFV